MTCFHSRPVELKIERNFDCVVLNNYKEQKYLLKWSSMKNDMIRKNLTKLFKYRNCNIKLNGILIIYDEVK